MFTAKMPLNNDEHMLIHVTMKMIQSAVSVCNRFVLKDGRLLHMVKLVGAVRNNHENTKNITIDVEDGTGLARVIVWRKEMEFIAALVLSCKC
jgi:hypothetical protein